MHRNFHSLHKMKYGDCQRILVARPIYASKLHLYHLWSSGTIALCIKIVGIRLRTLKEKEPQKNEYD